MLLSKERYSEFTPGLDENLDVVFDSIGPPKNHVGLMRQYLAKPPEVPAELIYENRPYKSVSEKLVLMLTRTSQDKKLFEFRDYVGHSYYYQSHGVSQARQTELSLVKNQKIAAAQFENLSKLSERKLKSFDFGAQNIDELSVRLATSQSKASATIQKSGSSKSLIAANAYMLKVLRSRKHLQVIDLESINALAIDGEKLSEGAELAGVVRGTVKEVQLGRGKLKLDAREIEASSGGVLNYLPASQVPSELKLWTAQVDAVTHASTLEQIALLTQRFIEIHPFVDANGRTAKIVLDMMVMKAGYPPIPHDSLLTKSFLFLSGPDLELFLKKAYNNAGLLQ